MAEMFKSILLIFQGGGAIARPRVSAPRRAKRKTISPARARIDARIAQIAKEAGIDPYTPEDLRQFEAEEAQAHNENHKALAFWAGSHEYKDVAGVWRDIETDEESR